MTPALSDVPVCSSWASSIWIAVLATALASVFGAPANTTYGENTGVLNLTKVFDPRVIRIAAFLAIAFSFCPKFAAVIAAMPAAAIVGIVLNAILPGKDYEFGTNRRADLTVNFSGATRNPNWREEHPEDAKL